MIDDPSLYLHRPTATDPNLAPEGKDAFYVLAPVPNLQRDDWNLVKKGIKERVLDILSSRILPNLRENIEVCFDFDQEFSLNLRPYTRNSHPR